MSLPKQQKPRTTQKTPFRLSISAAFYSSIAVMILAFALVTGFAYAKLSEFEELLTDITESSIPQFSVAQELQVEINQLLVLTDQLATVTTSPANRSLQAKLASQMRQLKTLNSANSNSSYTSTQLDVIALELEELKRLVSLRIESVDALNRTWNSIENQSKQLLSTLESAQQSHSIATIMLTAGQALNDNRLYQIRQSEQLLLNNHKQLKSTIDPSENTELSQLVHQLDILLFSESGLMKLKREQLQVRGRTIGRTNFVRNLISDFSHQIKVTSLKMNDDIRDESATISNSIDKQTRDVRVYSGFALIIIVIIVILMQRKITGRLLTLNMRVSASQQGEEVTNLQINGNDEISDLAKTFDYYVYTVEKQRAELRELSFTDDLTGIANRRALDANLNTTLSLARRHSWAVAIFLIDIDRFKDYNDAYGHNAGDSALKAVAQAIDKNISRETDFCARYGGEEFACVLLDESVDHVFIKAEELRLAIEHLQVTHTNNPPYHVITASVGIAIHKFEQDSWLNRNQLFEQADRALYQAKAAGRNCCRVYQKGTISTLTGRIAGNA